MTEKEKSSNSIKTIFILVLILLVVLFGISNNHNVVVKLLISDVNLPLTVVVILGVFVGFIAAMFYFVPAVSRRKKEIKAQNKDITHLEDRLKKLHDKLDDMD